MAFPTPPQSPSSNRSTSREGSVFGSPRGPVRLVSKLGRGSFGSVYKGMMKDGTKCAVKVVSYDSCMDAFDFEHEAEILEELQRNSKRLRNEHIVDFDGSGCEEDKVGLFFFPLADHGSLEEYVRNVGGRLDGAQSRRLLYQLNDGLAYIHSIGIYHRDIKPANVLMSSSAPGMSLF
ncbi:hypothetical protein QR680_000576 [Steinernema hermaphroditum]|uniref:Protein kinase domain-containing protein n=1 Tax=Steinernema hermaphroditum TaxID=289476 RepID=A0AA39GV42_9BILA|nr:hypothetical protein QR680_000576 [Steinernema hermaphroditum]